MPVSPPINKTLTQGFITTTHTDTHTSPVRVLKVVCSLVRLALTACLKQLDCYWKKSQRYLNLSFNSSTDASLIAPQKHLRLDHLLY